jgi:type IV pilus assembly protein PilE
MKTGFTLLEVLIVLVIITLLTSLALPNYYDYLVRSRRSDGQVALIDLASRMERYYSQHHSYIHATIGTGGVNDVLPTNQSPGGWYLLSILSASDSTYTLKASPTKAQANGDKICQALTLNQLGIKGSSAGSTSACWSWSKH